MRWKGPPWFPWKKSWGSPTISCIGTGHVCNLVCFGHWRATGKQLGDFTIDVLGGRSWKWKKKHQILNNVLEKTTLMISTDQRFFANLSNYNNLDMYDGYKLGCPRFNRWFAKVLDQCGETPGDRLCHSVRGENLVHALRHDPNM